MCDFWSERHLDLEDDLNAEIWHQSPIEQDRIQPYRPTWRPAAVGAQQAMRWPHRLPWVPDLVGRDWQAEDAVIVVGSAYGPFIAGPDRDHELPASEYAQPTAAAFQQRFLRRVVSTRRYYSEIAGLASTVMPDARKLVLTDLCRVAFVRNLDVADAGGDSVVKLDRALFNQYVEDPVARGWSWRRIEQSRARVVVALGTIAEHGLLRLFHASLEQPRIVDSVDPSLVWTPRRSRKADTWPIQYASDARKLKHRSAQGGGLPWWSIMGRTPAGEHRAWRLVVVPHPTGAFGSAGSYPQTVLQAALRT